MADAAWTTESLILYDNWPGVAVPPPFAVTDMTSAGVGHNMVHPRWDIGTKWELYCYGDQVSLGATYRQGFSTFIYLRAGPDAAAAVASIRTMFCVPDETFAAQDKDDLLYVMASDDDVTTHEYSGLVAVCLSTVTNDYYAWYWCGGVYPVEYIASGVVGDTVITDSLINTAGVEIQTLFNEDGDTGIKAALHATGSQTPGIGIALITD